MRSVWQEQAAPAQLQNQGTPLTGGGETYDSQCCVYGALDADGKSWVMEVCRWRSSQGHWIFKSRAALDADSRRSS
jgi:hypothetical protein